MCTQPVLTDLLLGKAHPGRSPIRRQSVLLSSALFGLSTDLLFLFSAPVFHIHEMLTLYTMSPAAAGRRGEEKPCHEQKHVMIFHCSQLSVDTEEERDLGAGSARLQRCSCGTTSMTQSTKIS